MDVRIGAAEFDASAAVVNVGWCEFDGLAGSDVRIGWCEFDAAAGTDVRVGWCEFDTDSHDQICVGWGEFDCRVPVVEPPPTYFGNGGSFPRNIHEFEIPMTLAEGEDEEAVVITLMMELAKYVLL